MTRDYLIARLEALAENRIAQKARNGRDRAILSLSQYCVVVTEDGRETREILFDRPPTIGQIAERVGPDAWAVSIRMRFAGRRGRRGDMAAE